MRRLAMNLAVLISFLFLISLNKNQVEGNPKPNLENELEFAPGESALLEPVEEIEPLNMDLDGGEGFHRAKRMKRQSSRHIFCGVEGRACDTHVDCCVEYGYKCHVSGFCFYHPGMGK